MSRFSLGATVIGVFFTVPLALTLISTAAMADEPAKVSHHHPMLFTNNPSRAYQELGLVGGSADVGIFKAGDSMDSALKEMETSAQQLGADAIICVQFTSCGIREYASIFVIGTAIRWKDGGTKSERNGGLDH